MNRSFDVDDYIARIGKRLVLEFDDAGTATSPGTIGSAREQPVRDQLEQLLPRGIAVGSGFVIDSEGGTSHQTDVVLYEKDICPVFSINNTPGTTYYPCEGVIAVGEVKSALDRNSLEDAFKKIASVKQLKRHVVHNPIPMPETGKLMTNTRGYGTIRGDSIINMDYDQQTAETAQILGVIIAGDLRTRDDTFCETFLELARGTGDQLCPNMVVILNGGVLTWGNITKGKVRNIERSEQSKGYVLAEREGNRPTWETSWSATKGSWIQYSREKESFRAAIRWIFQMYREGKTSDAKAFDRYFMKTNDPGRTEPTYLSKDGISLEEAILKLRIR
ncbi:MAG: hypothetical protein F4X66_09000 [Chloroflexi bacterium]|nr:hypothetical protein [Chloroflexota bacterium]